MTAVCPSGGTSSPKNNAQNTVILTAGNVTSFLPAGLSWLVQFLGSGLGLVDIDMPAFCAIDPPADPGLDGLDLLAIATAAPEFERPGARDRLRQLVRRYAWYQFCECDATGPLAPPTPPTVPSGAPTINPTGQAGPSAAPCYVETYAASVPSTATVLELKTGQLCGGSGQPSCASIASPIPAGAVALAHAYTTNAPGRTDANSSHVWSAVVWFYNAANTLTGFSTVSINDYGNFETINSGNHGTPTAIPAGSTKYAIQAQTNTGGFAWGVTATENWYCTLAPNTSGAQSCCTATDPITQGTLQAILQMVTLLQRQSTAFAYISGTAHHSLTGSGTIAVTGILGVLLNVSVPASYGTDFGTPDTRFDVGYIRFGTNDGYTSATRIDTDSQVILPESAGVFTLVAYTLSPGVSMTLTELLREAS